MCDVPLLSSDTIIKLIKEHQSSNADATILTAITDDLKGLGRIIRDKDGNIEKIVEDRDANEQEKKIREINSGIIIFKSKKLVELLKALKNDNDQNEYYLTDTIEEIKKSGSALSSYTIESMDEVTGINDRAQLAYASKIAQRNIINIHMLAGVTFEDPDNSYVETDVQIEQDVTILAGSRLEGKTYISEEAVIGPNSRITDAKIGKGTSVNSSIIVESSIGNNTKVGPFSYIRPGSQIGDDVKIGDFVEVKNSIVGNRTKSSHLAYIGDAQVGENCNIGCGVVIVNYDGKKKNRTIIGNNAFIGSNVNLVAPIEIADNAYIAAGSTITENVNEGALAIARSRQTVKEGWVERKNMFRK